MITETLNHSIIALIEHATGELSRLCRKQIKPALKLEFHSFCTSANKSDTHLDLLFGQDLAKQICHTKDASDIGQKISMSTRGM